MTFRGLNKASFRHFTFLVLFIILLNFTLTGLGSPKPPQQRGPSLTVTKVNTPLSLQRGGHRFFRPVEESLEGAQTALSVSAFVAGKEYLASHGLTVKTSQGLHGVPDCSKVETFIFPVDGSPKTVLGPIAIQSPEGKKSAERNAHQSRLDVDEYNAKYVAENAREGHRWMIYLYQPESPMVFYLEALRFADDTNPVIVLTSPGEGKLVFNLQEGIFYAIDPLLSSFFDTAAFWGCIKQAFGLPSSFNPLDIFVSICSLRSLPDAVKELVLMVRSCLNCGSLSILGCAECIYDWASYLACAAAGIAQCYSQATASGVQVEWVTRPPNTVRVGESYTAEWRITGGNWVNDTHLHFGTDSRLDISFCGTSSSQSGPPRLYRGTFSICPASYLPGATYYFAVHALVDGKDYYSPVVQSSVASLSQPQITDVLPRTVPVGVDTPLDVYGSGFLEGFEGRVIVGNVVFRLYGQGQTRFINSNHVVVVAKIGGDASAPSTFFSLRIVNSDGQESNEFPGLYAQNRGGNAGNLQITFSPNPVSRSSDGNWHYSVTIRETGSVGITLTSLLIDGQDYSHRIAQWFGSNRIPANGQASVNIYSFGYQAPYDLRWTFSGDDDNGNRGLRWTATVRFSP